jgi:hypothetical protein
VSGDLKVTRLKNANSASLDPSGIRFSFSGCGGASKECGRITNQSTIAYCDHHDGILDLEPIHITISIVRMVQVFTDFPGAVFRYTKRVYCSDTDCGEDEAEFR